MKTETLAVLIYARELLTDAAHWAKGFYAYDASGEMCGSYDDEAVCFCLQGAINRAIKHLGYYEPFATAQMIIQEIDTMFPEKSVVHWNDQKERTHGEVLAKLDELIRAA